MQRKLTISITDELYKSLHRRVGPGRISRFIEESVRPRLRLTDPLDEGYRRMAADQKEQAERREWVEFDPGADDSSDDILNVGKGVKIQLALS